MPLSNRYDLDGSIVTFLNGSKVRSDILKSHRGASDSLGYVDSPGGGYRVQSIASGSWVVEEGDSPISLGSPGKRWNDMEIRFPYLIHMETDVTVFVELSWIQAPTTQVAMNGNMIVEFPNKFRNGPVGIYPQFTMTDIFVTGIAAGFLPPQHVHWTIIGRTDTDPEAP